MQYMIAPGTVPLSQADTTPPSGTPGFATNGNPAAGISATRNYAWAMNMVFSELAQVVLDAGGTLDAVNWKQVSWAIQEFVANETRRATTIESNLQSGKQDKLGYTPVQQGTGTGQGSNVVKLGWDSGGSGRLRYQIDDTDEGNLANYADLVSINPVSYATHVVGIPAAGGQVATNYASNSAAKLRYIVCASANIAGNATQPAGCSLVIKIDGNPLVVDTTQSGIAISWAGEIDAGSHTFEAIYSAPAGSQTFFNTGVGMSVFAVPVA